MKPPKGVGEASLGHAVGDGTAFIFAMEIMVSHGTGWEFADLGPGVQTTEPHRSFGTPKYHTDGSP